MLSLSPRYDLLRVTLPKEFLAEEIEEKYTKILSKNNNVIVSPIDYLNESIQGITFPGISDIIIQQQQHGYNPINRKFGKINVEPKTDITYTNSANPLDKIEKSFKITFRLNQGFMNYFMIYETIFHQICKNINKPPLDLVTIEILDETGLIVAKISFEDVYLDGIEGLDFNYNKLERDSGTFDVNFKFNNINYEFFGI